MSKQVIVFPRGQLTAADKAAMAKGGVIAVEADTPSEVNAIEPTRHLSAKAISGDAFILAALHAIAKATSYQTANDFVGELNRRLLAAEKNRSAS